MDREEYPHLKRLYECYMADPGFLEDFHADPASCLERVRIAMDSDRAGELLADMPSQSWAVNPWLKAFRPYVDWALERTKQKTAKEMYVWPELYQHCQAVHQRMFLQTPFMEGHTSVRYYPIIFELSDGCSVQCPFCGLAAAKWRGDYRYDAEGNREEWRQILTDACHILGPVVLNAACYFATEPLDNPDYQLFLQDFREILGDYPQTTTAVADAKPESVRSLMGLLGEGGLKDACLRFSIRTKKQFYRIMQIYTPEELAYVEMLFNNPESRTTYSASGRIFDRTLSEDHMMARYSISCIAGAVVNLVRRTIAFTEPEIPSEAFPTGVRTWEIRSFGNADEFRQELQLLLRRYLRGSIQDACHDTLQLTEGVRVKRNDDGTLLVAGPARGVTMKADLALAGALEMLAGQASTLEQIENRLFLNQLSRIRLHSQLNVLFQKGYLRCFPVNDEEQTI